MKFNYVSFVVLLVFSFFLTGCVNKKNKIEPIADNQRSYNANYQITVYNNSKNNIKIIDKKIVIGNGIESPPQK